MALGVVWTFAGIVIKENAKSAEPTKQETQIEEQTKEP
jgi:hypothetical protein